MRVNWSALSNASNIGTFILTAILVAPTIWALTLGHTTAILPNAQQQPPNVQQQQPPLSSEDSVARRWGPSLALSACLLMAGVLHFFAARQKAAPSSNSVQPDADDDLPPMTQVERAELKTFVVRFVQQKMHPASCDLPNALRVVMSRTLAAAPAATNKLIVDTVVRQAQEPYYVASRLYTDPWSRSYPQLVNDLKLFVQAYRVQKTLLEAATAALECANDAAFTKWRTADDRLEDAIGTAQQMRGLEDLRNV